jgi:hypothetical protein
MSPQRTKDDVPDTWYVRLPNGRVVRARSTQKLRAHLGRGNIPTSSLVRRSPREKWRPLGSIGEFADLLLPAAVNGNNALAVPGPAVETPSVAARLDPTRLRTLGLGAIFQELLGALDSTLVRGKLLVAAVPALLGGILLACLDGGLLDRVFPEAWQRGGVAGLLLTLLGAAGVSLLTQMTYLEAATLRPVPWREARAGLFRSTGRVLLAWLLVGGPVATVFVVLRWLPGWLLAAGDSAGLAPAVSTAAAQGLAAAALMVETLLWPVLILGLLLAPVVIIEPGPVWSALGRWRQLLRRQVFRIFCAEALAVALGSLAALGLALPFLLALWTSPGDGRFAAALGFVGHILAAAACAPLLAYLAVVNVFLYLYLAYGSETNEREK